MVPNFLTKLFLMYSVHSSSRPWCIPTFTAKSAIIRTQAHYWHWEGKACQRPWLNNFSSLRLRVTLEKLNTLGRNLNTRSLLWQLPPDSCPWWFVRDLDTFVGMAYLKSRFPSLTSISCKFQWPSFFRLHKSRLLSVLHLMYRNDIDRRVKQKGTES